MTDHPPSQKHIGARIRIKPEHAPSVAELFTASNFTPVYVEYRSDGNVSFWFDKVAARSPAFVKTVEAIPFAHWAIHAIVGRPTLQ
ncbi:hypothetical protein [Sphingomonas sp. 28-63-12]|uniref:hypothetical protein n=1 Tax=Sphingomonas sp. 28-63-12 TaxID=1970434 RepID=UPI0035A85397